MATVFGALTILTASGASQAAWSSQKDECIELPKIPLKQDSILNAILTDIFDDVSEKGIDKSNFYTVDMTTVNGSQVVLITQEFLDHLPSGAGCAGYDIFKGKTVFVFSDGVYQLPKSENSATVVYRVKKPLPCPYDPEEWHFIIKDDSYARYIYGFGWLWDKRDSAKSKKQLIKIEAPKRKKK